MGIRLPGRGHHGLLVRRRRLVSGYGVFAGNSQRRAQVVGARKPDDFGLFDMHGNLSEWCQDGYASETDDAGRVLRGGTFLDTADRTTCGARDNGPPGQGRNQSGFRVARGYP